MLILVFFFKYLSIVVLPLASFIVLHFVFLFYVTLPFTSSLPTFTPSSLPVYFTFLTFTSICARRRHVPLSPHPQRPSFCLVSSPTGWGTVLSSAPLKCTGQTSSSQEPICQNQSPSEVACQSPSQSHSAIPSNLFITLGNEIYPSKTYPAGGAVLHLLGLLMLLKALSLFPLRAKLTLTLTRQGKSACTS